MGTGSLSAAVSFKKKDGTLTLSKDHQTLTWASSTSGPPQVMITVASITSEFQLAATEEDFWFRRGARLDVTGAAND